MGWISFTQVAKENLHFTWGYWTGNEIRHSVMRALKAIEKDISYKSIYMHISMAKNVNSCKLFYNVTGKREKPYNHWEPIYIGTNEVLPCPVRFPNQHGPWSVSGTPEALQGPLTGSRASGSLVGLPTLWPPVRNQLMTRGWLGRDDLTRWFRFEK